MKISDPIVFRELPIIQKIIQDETWLEAERRGCFVGPNDTVVREKVCEIILRIGQQLRASLEAAMVRSQNDESLVTEHMADITDMSVANSNEAA